MSPTADDKLRIVMPPLGHVFGAGWHPVTQASLLALPDLVTTGMSFAEIGAGSAILCVAAKLLGAGKCYALEINPECLVAARKVIDANGLDIELIDGTYPPERVDLAIVSIGTQFAKDNLGKFDCHRLMVVTDENVIEDWSDLR